MKTYIEFLNENKSFGKDDLINKIRLYLEFLNTEERFGYYLKKTYYELHNIKDNIYLKKDPIDVSYSFYSLKTDEIKKLTHLELKTFLEKLKQHLKNN